MTTFEKLFVENVPKLKCVLQNNSFSLLNVDGSQMIKGLHYEETYAPVVQWATIRFFISLAILSNWHTRQLDFVLAYTQADIERDYR